MSRCHFPSGMTVRPDGINPLDPCIYKTVEKYQNVTVEVMRCTKCGHIEVVWHRQEDTERVTEDG